MKEEGRGSGNRMGSAAEKRRKAVLLGAVGICLALGGCANVKPWEREILADPIMGINGGSAKDNLMEKFYSTREGSTGGGSGVGGGCGCSK
ncbi:MAG: hypothetical protein JWO30_300 [Fibrobacteres bacterium]|nr:hypothetical protein [Fibrobacterota bacterium]